MIFYRQKKLLLFRDRDIGVIADFTVKIFGKSCIMLVGVGVLGWVEGLVGGWVGGWVGEFCRIGLGWGWGLGLGLGWFGPFGGVWDCVFWGVGVWFGLGGTVFGPFQK
jgi:hypothetical protein